MDFLSPAAFAFLATLPVVILFYLLKRKRVVKLVPSTLLWQRYLAETQASAPFQKLRHNWLLILQLLLLTLIIFALSRPYFAGHVKGGRLHVLVLDASASMQSKDESPSRFDKARSEALKYVNTLHDTDQMIVLLAGAVTEVKQSPTSSKAALNRAIQGCQVTDSSTHLKEALKLAEILTRDRADAEIHLMSDGAANDLSEFENKGLKLVYHKIGTRGHNAGIISLDVRSNPENPAQRAVFTSVANYADSPRSATLDLRFDGQLVDSRNIEIAATNSSAQVFLVNQTHDGIFTVQLKGEDDLAADDQASVVSLLPKPVKVMLVSHGIRFLEKALHAAGDVQLTVVADCSDEHPDADLVVLDNVIPTRWPVANILAFRASAPTWFPVGGKIENPPILDWKSAHPLLRFVSFDNVNVAEALTVKAPPWAASIVDSRDASLILAGETAKQRIVWVAFDPMDSTWPLRISFPIFVANVVDWLNPASASASQLLVRAGEPLHLSLFENATNAVITLPNGATRRTTVEPNARELIFGDTSHQGTYQLQVGTNKMAFCVNLLDATESDTRPREELAFGKFTRLKASALSKANLEIWRWIAFAGLAVMMVEWWYFHRRTA